MIVYEIVSIICLVFLLIHCVQTVYQLLTYTREERIELVRNYKKGKVIIVYLVALPLYFLADFYVTGELFASIKTALANSVGLVALSLDPTGHTLVLAAQSLVYKIALYSCYVLAYFNFVMFVVSIFFEYAISYWHAFTFHISTKTKCVILGNNTGSITLYQTCNEKRKMLVDILGKEEKTALYIKGVQSLSFLRWEMAYDWIFREAKRLARVHALKRNGLFSAKNKLVVIVNTGDDTLNLKICDALMQKLKTCGKEVAGCLQIHVYGSSEHADVYGEYETKAIGCMEHVDKYTLSAIELIDKYPMTKFLSEKHMDFKTSCIKENVDLNVVFVGFGKRNRRAFLTMVANEQYLTNTAQGVDVKKVHYHLFDKAETDNHKNLNHTYYRYRHNFVENADNVDVNAYLPLPSLPAEETYHCLDIHSIAFYDELKKIVCKKNPMLTHIVISFGSDLDNADFAHKILMKLNEWDVTDAQVFVKVKDEELNETLDNLLVFKNCHLFGNRDKCDYNYNVVVNEKFQNMALQRNFIYDVEYDIKHAHVQEITQEYLREKRMQSKQNWYIKRTYIERESNMFACLSLRQKLQMMGLDYCEASADVQGLTYEEYVQIYAGDDKPVLGAHYEETDKTIVQYGLEFADSRRRTMAIQEHYRWNAYMFTRGFVPSTKECILTEKNKEDKFTNGKSYLLRRHGNLTTMEGLVEFRKMIAKRNGTEEKEEDVIQYDYQILDDAYWLLQRNGYKIIVKQ